MVLSITLLLPITPRHRLVVTNYLKVRKVAYIPVKAVRVFKHMPRVVTPILGPRRWVFVISEGARQSQTGITQPDWSLRLWISKESLYL